MKTVRDVMTKDVVWVSPSARVRSAVLLLKGHNIGALPVVEADTKVIGIVTSHCLLGEPDDAAVTDVMSTEIDEVQPDITIVDAAEIMQKSGARHLIVMEQDKLIGIVSNNDMISELGKTFDPLTSLPWSDTFREWAMNALKHGSEISIILFDMDQFGKINKQFGHVVGDTVLKTVSDILKKDVNPQTDSVCRYGGDEFAIVSIRHADESEKLAEGLQQKICAIKIDDIPDGVSITFGIAGGRRTKEREDMHYAATIDNLINRASKECMKKKPALAEVMQKVTSNSQVIQYPHETSVSLKEGLGMSRLKIDTLGISMSGPEVTADVTLMRNGIRYNREVTGYVVAGASTLRLIAEATASAASKSLSPGYGVVVDDVLITSTGKQEEVISVVAVFISPRSAIRTVGSALVQNGDQIRAAASALLAAVNRQIENAPQVMATKEDEDYSETSIPPRGVASASIRHHI